MATTTSSSPKTVSLTTIDLMKPTPSNKSLKAEGAADPLYAKGAKLIRSTSVTARGAFGLHKPGPKDAAGVAAMWVAQAEETLSAAEALRALELHRIRRPIKLDWLPEGTLPLMPTAYFLLTVAVEQEAKAYAAKALCANNPSTGFDELIRKLGSHDTVTLLRNAGFPAEKLSMIESDMMQCKAWVMDGKYPTEKRGGEIQETLEGDHFGKSLETLNVIKAEGVKFLHAATDTGDKWIVMPS